MAIGTVKWFDAGKGFGFIVPGESGGDVFVRPQDFAESGLTALEQGQRVSFELVPGEGGEMSATDIRIVASKVQP